MDRIIAPILLNDRGSAVHNLQDGLRRLLDKGVFQLSDDDRHNFEEGLRVDRTETIYGSATRKLVRLFQEQHQLEPKDEVDERTADVINAILQEWGLFDQHAQERSLIVSGQ